MLHQSWSTGWNDILKQMCDDQLAETHHETTHHETTRHETTRHETTTMKPHAITNYPWVSDVWEYNIKQHITGLTACVNQFLPIMSTYC